MRTRVKKFKIRCSKCKTYITDIDKNKTYNYLLPFVVCKGGNFVVESKTISKRLIDGISLLEVLCDCKIRRENSKKVIYSYRCTYFIDKVYYSKPEVLKFLPFLHNTIDIETQKRLGMLGKI